MEALEIGIAGLLLNLHSNNKYLNISLPICHREFTQPAELAQAGLNSPKKNHRLYLDFIDSRPHNFAGGHSIYRSESWELLISHEAEWVFYAPSEMLPYSIYVSTDFSQGKVVGDFSQLAGKPNYPIEVLEIRLFSAWLASLGDLILHASGVALNGKGYCFVGESGAGKSTLAAVLAADPAVTVLGEDQVILRYLDGKFWIFGTPWHMDPKMCSPLGVPLEKLYFLDRSLPPGVREVKPGQGVANLMQTAFIPYYLREFLPGILDRLSLLAERVPFYTLSYNMGSDPLPLLR